MTLVKWTQGKCDEAEPLLWHSMQIAARVHGIEHPIYANHTINLAYALFDQVWALLFTTGALIMWIQCKYNEVERLTRVAIAIVEKVYGKMHRKYARSLKLQNLLFVRTLGNAFVVPST